MATMTSFLQFHTYLQHSPTKPTITFPCIKSSTSISTCCCYGYGVSSLKLKPKISTRVSASVAEETTSAPLVYSISSNEEAARRVYIGNIPRNLKNDDLLQIVQQHGVVEIAQVMFDKFSGRSRRFGFATMKTVDDANAVVEKLNGTEIGGRKIKANITEKPLESGTVSVLQSDESQFVDSGHKVYIGNLAKTVTTDVLKNFFSEKGNVISAKVQRAPGTSKSNGFGFVCFSSDEEAEAAITAFNNAVLEGKNIRVNKA